MNDPQTLDLGAALAFLVDTARGAGEVLTGYDHPVPRLVPVMKGLRDPVTEADLAAERFIVERLRQRWPELAIHAEEETHDAQGDGLAAYVDPLDGTVNFSQAHPFFAVSVGLYVGREALAGVVHAPRLGETFAAARGQGATLNGLPLAVSRKARLIDSILATGFAYQRHELDDDNLGHFGDFILAVRGLRRCGSAALDLAYVAAGRLDGYWEPHLNSFDVAAGALLVQEAGGLVTDMDGGDDWLHGGSILAAPAALHAPMLAVLREGRA